MLKGRGKRLSYGVLLLVMLIVFSILPLGAQTHAPPLATDRFIVVLSDEVAADEAESVAVELARRHEAVLEHVYKQAIKGFSARIPTHGISALRADPRVNNVVTDQKVQAFCHTSTTQTLPTGIERIDANLSPTANINNGGTGPSGQPNNVNADIAILDTGIYLHRDLNVFKAFDCTKSGCPQVTPSDKNGHGTHVAGIAAARDNTNSVVGVAPGARLWQVKVLGNNGSGYTSWVIAGINKVTANAASIAVANMSLGGSGSDTGNCGVSATGRVNDPLHKAICTSVAKGVVYTVAAGNESQDGANVTPAAYPEVITVSALADSDGKPGGLGSPTSYGADDTFATFSNFGKVIDLIAPGVDIFSTWPGDSAAPQGYCATASGTSMASPHVAGAVALYLATHPKPTNTTSVSAVRVALRAAGQCPDFTVTGSDGNCHGAPWRNDPDGITEPLVYVGGL